MSKKSYVAENGITLGLAGLALLVIFAIALPKWVHNDDTRPINLPDSLSNGMVLVGGSTLPKGFDAPSVQSVVDGLKSVDKSETDAAGGSSRTALYISADGNNALMFQVVRGGSSESALLMPPDVPGTYSKVGEDVCYTRTQTQQSAVSGVTCRRSSSTWTVQVTAEASPQGGTQSSDAETAKALDEIWSKVS